MSVHTDEFHEYIDFSNLTDIAEIVKIGYQSAALEYRGQKDSSILNLHIFQQWLSHIPLDGVIAELGCGSGYPVAHHIASITKDSNRVSDEILGTPLKYIGVDISDDQIQMAKESLKGYENNISFVVSEMLEWVKKQPDQSLNGVVCLFSIFHLPRVCHVEFFLHIQRVLKPNGSVLFTVPQSPSEGFEDSWLGVKMYWSSFSHQWYEMTLSDLGMEFIAKYKDVRDFLGQKETAWFMLYEKPMTALNLLT